VTKRATPLVVLTVAAAIGLTACASKTETVSTAPPPEPYVAPAPTRKYVSKRRASRKARRHVRRHKVTTTSTTTTTTAPSR
jgi:type IV pilus biogenesis protein CpaD/CtpE